MKILLLGSGGREHALAWKLAQSKHVHKIFCAPGNGGIADIAECLDIKADDIPALLDFARRERIDLTVVGPEALLAGGIVDTFTAQKLAIFGPSQKAARLEGSKIFSKELMCRHKVPTAAYKVFDKASAAHDYIDQQGGACVVKADGLAQGKGVVVAEDAQHAHQAVRMMLEERVFGEAGSRIIIEECLQGQEASILVITDSRQIIMLASSQDHKRAFDNDTGPNTGGMGAYSPTPVVTPALTEEILETIILRTIDGLVKEGIDYRGVLYAGIMITRDGPRALEFNVRFGDPETQVILPRLESDLFEVMMATVSQSLGKFARAGGLKWNGAPCVCVVLSSGGYPGSYEKGKIISGLADAQAMQGVFVFHAGTKKTIVSGLPQYQTDGGRVLGVTALGTSVVEAIDTVYEAAGRIHFDGMHYRKDIGRKACVYR